MKIFVTGASGWIGSAVVPELQRAGHQVVGLARSDASADKLAAAGVEVRRGDLDDPAGLAAIAAEVDGVIHLAFQHDVAFSGDFAGATLADRRTVLAIGDALAGSDRPLVLASGLLGVNPGHVAVERDGLMPPEAMQGTPGWSRHATALLALSLAGVGVRSVVLRLPPSVHGEGDNGFVPTLIEAAREVGAAGYVGDGANRWPAVHRSDAARLFRLAAESAPAGTVLHAVGDEGVPIKEVAAVFARHLDLPSVSVQPDDLGEYFSWLGGFIGVDAPASAVATSQLLGWTPTGPSLLEDLEAGHYFG